MAAIVAAVVVGTVGMFVLYVFASGSAHGYRSLDDADINDAADAGCLDVIRTIESASGDRSTRIVAGNDAIARSSRASGAGRWPALERSFRNRMGR